MFTDRGRPILARRVDTAVYAAADAAGIGHATPHQLRHTLATQATQAINNGMSLEAVAALLGHTSLSMTYARIADRTVATEYFDVTERAAWSSTGGPCGFAGDVARVGRQIRA